MMGASPTDGVDPRFPVILPRPSADQAQQVRRSLMRAAGLDTPSSFNGEQLSALRRMVGELGAEVTHRISKDLGLSIEAVPTWTHEMLWREARGVPVGRAVNIVLRPSLGGVALLAVDPALVAMVAEQILGTEPDPARGLRPVTPADRCLASRFTDVFIDMADQLWDEATGSRLLLESQALYKDSDVPIDLTETVLVMPIEVQLFGTYSVIHVIITEATIPPVASALSRPSAKGIFDDPSQLRAVQSRIAEVNLDLHAQLGRVRLSAAAITRLKPGDRLDVGKAEDDVALTVDGHVIRRGRPGKVGTQRAVQLAAGGLANHG